MKKTYIGIDIGGTNVKIGLFDETISLLQKISVPMPSDMSAADVVDGIGEASKSLLTKACIDVESVAGIGIGTPGPADYPNGIVIASANIPAFRNIPLRDMISEKIGNKPAVLENDANVACWGEFAEGAGKGVKDMIFFTLGTGVGGGIVAHGELITGTGHNAAELGHIILYPDGRPCKCGQKGCFEVYASASYTALRANEILKGGAESSLCDVAKSQGEVTSKDVFGHAAQGDATAIEIVEETAKSIAIMCVNMLHTTEPEKIVFSGGMIAAGSELLDRIKRHFDDYIWTLKKEPVEICFATLGEDTGIIGAASLAKHKVSQKD